MTGPHSFPTALVATAYHEAGHAVMAYWLGRRLEFVEVDPSALGGRTRVCQCDDWLREALTALAGPAASGRFDPEAAGPSGNMPGQTGDAIHATNKLQEAFPDDEALGLSDVRFREWQDVARIMIARPPLWRAIVAVAEALPRSGWHLDGPTATAIIEAAMKHEGP